MPAKAKPAPKKVRKPMSEEAKQAMLEKRRATLAAKQVEKLGLLARGHALVDRVLDRKILAPLLVVPGRIVVLDGREQLGSQGRDLGPALRAVLVNLGHSALVRE